MLWRGENLISRCSCEEKDEIVINILKQLSLYKGVEKAGEVGSLKVGERRHIRDCEGGRWMERDMREHRNNLNPVCATIT